MTLMDGNDQANQDGQNQEDQGDQGNQGTQENQGDQGTAQVPEWLAGVEDENLRSEDALNILGRYKTPEEQLKAHVEARKKLGENPITVPGENATDEERAEFYKALGRPETPDGYEFTQVEGVEGNDEMDRAFKETVHQLGMPPEMADGVHQFLANYAKEWEAEQAQALQQAHAETEKALKQEYGKDYDTNIKAADNALANIFGETAMEKLKAAGLHVDADVIRGAVKLSQAVSEDKLRGMGDGQGSGAVKSRAELEDIMKKNPDWKSDPAIRKQVEDGFRALYPETGVAAYTDPAEAQAH